MKPFSPEQEEHFPLSSEPGASVSNINSSMMRSLTESNELLQQENFEEIINEHKKFIEAGGMGGKWQTFVTSGLVLGVYFGVTVSNGKQADFFHKKFTGLDLKNRNYSASNFIASIGEGVDISYSQMENCIFTDAFWKIANFENCNLKGTDFSRSDLSGCNFRYCNLENTDFENCNLENADFTGAILTGSRFPGAILTGVKY